MQKPYLLLGIILVISMKISAQENSIIKSDDLFDKVYNRSSISFFIINHLDDKKEMIYDEFKNFSFDKYNLNKLPFNSMNSYLSRDDLSGTSQKANKIENVLKNNNVAKKVVEYWVNRDENGYMNTNRIAKRGLYNATDHDVQVSKLTKRGNAMLEDAGIKLMEKSYIVVFDISDIDKVYSKSGSLTYTGYIETYIYSIKLNDEVQALLWDSWLDEKTDKHKIKKQIEKFEKIPFKLNFENKSFDAIETSTGFAMLNAFYEIVYLNNDGLKYKGDGVPEFKKFVKSALNTGMKAMEKLNNEFKVKSVINGTVPVVKVKIGTKEGLKRKQMYEVFEGTYNAKTDIIQSKKIGLIRAGYIADNRQNASGNSLSSEFAIIQQNKKITPYMYIQQKNDKMISLYIDYIGSSSIKHSTVGMNYLTFITSKSLYGSLIMNMSLSTTTVNETVYNYYSDRLYQNYVDNVSFCFGFGYLLGINIPYAPNFKAETFMTFGFGFSSYSPSLSTDDGDAAFNEVIFSGLKPLIIV
ncbi:MAG: hypothetical protein B6I20_08655 [Bacteroidetes bacterium 4572_117]|nr:MAG: hypothetical protein B6I20_08655 [Bacteroidetes bacterium 4572_117]